MITENITIINKLGLHARAAAKLVSIAGKFHSNIDITHGTKTINTKSIMGVMMLAASQGTVLTLVIEGDDEIAARDAIVGLVNDYFGEGE